MSAPAPAALSVTEATFSYGAGRSAILGVDLRVERGEVVGLVGPNGSGKSTLIRLVFDLLALPLGVVSIDGHRHRDEAARTASLYLPSDDELPEFLTGIEYARLVGRLYGAPEPVGRASLREQFVRYGMAGREGDMIEDYSHGMRKKLQLIVAFLLARPLTVIDETLNGIDLDALRACRRDLLRLRATDRGVLLCTHDFSLLEDVADRLVVLKDGEVVDHVRIADVRARGERLSDVVSASVFADDLA